MLDNPTVMGLSEGAKLYIVRSDMKEVGDTVPPKQIKVINNKNGYEFLLSKREFFDNTEKIGITEI